MKRLLTLSLISFFYLSSFSQTTATNRLKEEAIGRCTGSAYCSACRNCSRCAHCSSGGTCGVCASSSVSSSNYYSSRTYSKRRSYRSTTTNRKKRSYNTYNYVSGSRKRPSATYTQRNNYNTFLATTNLKVVVNELNLRSGPGSSYPIIEKLKRSQELVFISTHGQWTKVKWLNREI